MGELKTFWDNPGMPMSTDLGGDTVVSSGSDPQVSTDGSSPISPFWPEPPVPTLTSGEETSNSVSGLPPQPNRFEPPTVPPEPPTLKDRNPGTIDER
jgi:hypothetical protein